MDGNVTPFNVRVFFVTSLAVPFLPTTFVIVSSPKLFQSQKHFIVTFDVIAW